MVIGHWSLVIGHWRALHARPVFCSSRPTLSVRIPTQAGPTATRCTNTHTTTLPIPSRLP
ncbi:hypothetical protein CMV30_05630 [Nibricoccus aquaticus]|uniref:Uncharacterized protein n=1 Tax=Nibricoccus aquaticus TaxID=2576891 RepID=A0A290QB76_9BACT|nr:hypothetical protein CMV30_05630 [Nibricoccus aquaticus]